jgi:hypothetical protein
MAPAPMGMTAFNTYMWDSELFSEFAAYYLASEFTVIKNYFVFQTMENYRETEFFYWNKFFGLVEKYGYAKISGTFKEMTAQMTDEAALDEESYEGPRFDLFKQVLSQKTGDAIDEYFTGSYITIRGRHYDTEFAGELRSLAFADLRDSDIESMGYMTKLKTLDLQGNQISDIGALGKLINLRQLDLRSNPIKDISALANLANLTWLGLGENDIGDFNVLAELVNLTGLILADSQVSDASMLANLTNLTHLFLSDNQIGSIEPFKKLTNLIRLDLQGNPLSSEQIAELRSALPNTEIIFD